MKKYFLLPIAAFISLLSIYGFQLAKDWRLYSSAEGHFSIQFPGTPEETSQDNKTDDGAVFTSHLVTFSPSDDEVYMVGWTDMHGIYPEGKTMEEILEGSRDGAMASMNATNVTTLTTVVTNDPYIDFTFEGDGFVGKDRIYVINKMQYSVITMFATQIGLKPDADKFIGSFSSIK